MQNCLHIVLALLLATQGLYLANVSGHILDSEGKPLAGAKVIYKKDRHLHPKLQHRGWNTNGISADDRRHRTCLPDQD